MIHVIAPEFTMNSKLTADCSVRTSCGYINPTGEKKSSSILLCFAACSTITLTLRIECEHVVASKEDRAFFFSPDRIND